MNVDVAEKWTVQCNLICEISTTQYLQYVGYINTYDVARLCVDGF